jgi:hypothetical protein
MLNFGRRFCLVAAHQCEAGGGDDPKYIALHSGVLI